MESAREYLSKLSQRNLEFAYAAAGDYCLGQETRDEIIERIITWAMKEEDILFGALRIKPIDIMGKPNFRNSREREY